jgi:hypothetical protein
MKKWVACGETCLTDGQTRLWQLEGSHFRDKALDMLDAYEECADVLRRMGQDCGPAAAALRRLREARGTSTAGSAGF